MKNVSNSKLIKNIIVQLTKARTWIRLTTTIGSMRSVVARGRDAVGDTCALEGWGEAALRLVEWLRGGREDRRTIMGPFCSNWCRRCGWGGWAACSASASTFITPFQSERERAEWKWGQLARISWLDKMWLLLLVVVLYLNHFISVITDCVELRCSLLITGQFIAEN